MLVFFKSHNFIFFRLFDIDKSLLDEGLPRVDAESKIKPENLKPQTDESLNEKTESNEEEESSESEGEEESEGKKKKPKEKIGFRDRKVKN